MDNSLENFSQICLIRSCISWEIGDGSHDPLLRQAGYIVQEAATTKRKAVTETERAVTALSLIRLIDSPSDL